MADTEAGSCEQPCSHMVAWREKPDMLQLRVSPARGIAEHMQEGRGGRAGTGARPGGWGGGVQLCEPHYSDVLAIAVPLLEARHAMALKAAISHRRSCVLARELRERSSRNGVIWFRPCDSCLTPGPQL